MGVDVEHLRSLYADTNDPWGFEHSHYEQAKFKATREALSQASYQSAFELGCGNGQLARHLSLIVARYTGMDAVDKALVAARETVPSGQFLEGYYPCPLPDHDYDLLILSEILYFLDRDSIRQLATDIATHWPDAEVICVTYLGPSGNELQGDEAASTFIADLVTHSFEIVVHTESYRIDRGLPAERS